MHHKPATLLPLITGYPIRFFEYLSPTNLTLAVYIMVQNTMIIYDYWKDRTKLSSFLFILIAAVDIGSASFVMARGSVALQCLNNKFLTVPSWIFAAYLSFGLLCYVTSTFLGMVLTVVKTINIINPFYRIQGRALRISLAIFTLVGLAFTVVDIWYWNKKLTPHDSRQKNCVDGPWQGMHYVEFVGEAAISEIIFNFFKTNRNTKTKYLDLAELILLSLEFCLPGLIVLVCTALQIVYIRKAFRDSTDPGENTANHVTITIFLISLLYLLSISVYSVVLFRRIYFALKHRLIDDVYLGYELEMAAKYTLPLVNAALFPTILILRKPELRARYRKYILTVLYLPVSVLCTTFQRN